MGASIKDRRGDGKDGGVAGALLVVATPIGNLGDISARAAAALRDADLILAEDTRRASVLLRHLNVATPAESFHDHNERARLDGVVRRLTGGANIALISDAGTPLINDPGYALVRRAREAGVTVTPLPGACALTAALSASGQPADRFCFEGFLPPRVAARRRRLHELKNESRTLIFFEASHRINAMLVDIAAVFGGERELTVAREMTKKFESFYFGTAAEVAATVAGDARHRKGEFVIVVAGTDDTDGDADADRAREAMEMLSAELPLKRASEIAAVILKQNRNQLYKLGLKIKSQKSHAES